MAPMLVADEISGKEPPMWKNLRLATFVLTLLAVAAAWMLPTADAEAPSSSPVPETATVESAAPETPPATFDLEELLRQEVLDCSQYPNPRCDPNTDPNCKCDPECDPEVDSECVICEDQCSGPDLDPIG